MPSNAINTKNQPMISNGYRQLVRIQYNIPALSRPNRILHRLTRILDGFNQLDFRLQAALLIGLLCIACCLNHP